MRYETKIVREGELLGPVDYDYNFLQHFDCYSCSPEEKQKMCDKRVEMLRQIEADPHSWKATLSHSFVSKQVLSVGMYDGWPYWRPIPALLVSGTLGAEWNFFYDIQEIKRIPENAG